MREITEKSVAAFKSATNVSISNTNVLSYESRVTMFLHGNRIAELDRRNSELTIWNCGYRTNVTKERLNGILFAYDLDKIIQKAGVWYRADKKFIDGEVIKL